MAKDKRDLDKGDLTKLVRTILQVVGIEIEGELKVLRRQLGEGIIRDIAITTVESFIKLFGDGKYTIEGDDVTVKGIDIEPFCITYICIEAEYENGDWEVKIYTDEEEIFSTEIEQLNDRAQNIADRIRTALQSVSVLIQISRQVADIIREYYSQNPQG